MNRRVPLPEPVAGGVALRRAWVPGALCALLVACAAGKTADPTGGGGSSTTTTSATSTTTTTTSDTSTGGGGAGGSMTTTAGGAGGEGGATTTATATGGAGGSGGTTSSTSEGGSGGGGMSTGSVLLLAGGASSLLEATFDESTGWSTATLASGMTSTPAVALESETVGLGVFLGPSGNAPLFVEWKGASFTAPLAIGMQPSAKGALSMARGQDAYFVGYWGTENAHYLVRYAGAMGGWSLPEAVQPPEPGGFHSMGNSEPSVAMSGSDVILAHAGTDGKVYEQLRVAGEWQAATGHDVGGASTTVAPTIVGLSGGADDLMIVYVRASNSQIGWMTRQAGAPGAWGAGALITDALTQTAVAVAPLANGGAVMAFRGLNSGVYTSVYTPGANPPWSPPAALASLSVTTPSRPAVAPGLGAAAAELAFVDAATGAVNHARLVNGQWSDPQVVGGTGLQFVGMASFASQ